MAWSVDRLGRSLQDLVAFLGELHALGVDLFLHQQGLDTTTPAGKAMFQMMGVFAEFSGRSSKNGCAPACGGARSEGKRLGRPKIDADVEAAIQAALRKKDRPGVRVIAAAHGALASARCSASRTRSDREVDRALGRLPLRPSSKGCGPLGAAIRG